MRRLIRPKGIHILLIISAVICWVMTGMVFMQDELSALSRLRFDSFSELFDKGIRPDGHPAFVQFFLYIWTSVFGASEWAVKIPSFFCGIGAMVCTYKLGRKFFDAEVGLIATAFVAFSQFFAMYFSLARPYAYGTFFILAQIYALAQWQDRGAGKYRWRFILFSVLAAYTHYFSMMAAGLVALWGFIWLKRSRWKEYLIGLLVSVLLFLPHIPISMDQIAKGGIGGPEGWLAAPESDYLWKFISYLGQYHWLGIVVILGSLILTLIRLPRMNSDQGRFLLLGFSLLLIPFAIGYQYSIHVNPVLQFSVLIFGVPTFLIAIFGAWRFFHERVKTAFLLLVICSGLYGLIEVRHHPAMMSTQPFEELAKAAAAEGENAETVTIFHSMAPSFMEAYAENRELEYDYLQIEEVPLQELKQSFETIQGPMIGIGGPPQELQMMLRDEYGEDFRSLQLQTFDQLILRSSHSYGESSAALVDSISELILARPEGQEWGAAFEMDLNEVPGFPWLSLNLSQMIQAGSIPEATLVSEIYMGDSLIHWLGRDLKSYSVLEDSTCTAYLSYRLQDVIKEENRDKELRWRVYFWNRGRQALQGPGMRIRIYPDMATRYGLFNEF